MALQALLSRDTVTITRQSDSPTQQSTGSFSPDHSAANRTSENKPTTWKCRAQEITAEEKLEYGVEGHRIGWKFLSTTNPQVDEQDEFSFTDSEGVSHTNIRILGKQRNADNQGRLFVVIAEEDSTRV